MVLQTRQGAVERLIFLFYPLFPKIHVTTQAQTAQSGKEEDPEENGASAESGKEVNRNVFVLCSGLPPSSSYAST